MTRRNALSAGKKRLCYAAAFLVILGIEVLIGLFARGFVRNSLGDVLAVMGVYCAGRAAFPEKPAFLSAWVTGFAFAVELVQLSDLSALFGEGSLFSIVVGATFDPHDLICYAAGGAVCAVWDVVRINLVKK